MTRYDDDETTVPELSTQLLRHLSACDARLNAMKMAPEIGRGIIQEADRDGPLKINPVTDDQASAETIRLMAARIDIVSNCSDAEMIEYNAYLEAMAPKEMSDEEKEALLKRLNAQKDRVSH